MSAGSTVDNLMAVFAKKTKAAQPEILKGYFIQSKIFIFGILMVPTAPEFAKIHEKFRRFGPPLVLRSISQKNGVQ